MSSEREAVVSAISTSPNLGVAARKLGASRRTLQNRMRFYGLPRGHSGRPRQALPKKHGAHMIIGTTDLLLIGGVGAALFFARRWWQRPSSPARLSVVGDSSSSSSSYLRGLDAQIL